MPLPDWAYRNLERHHLGPRHRQRIHDIPTMPWEYRARDPFDGCIFTVPYPTIDPVRHVVARRFLVKTIVGRISFRNLFPPIVNRGRIPAQHQECFV